MQLRSPLDIFVSSEFYNIHHHHLSLSRFLTILLNRSLDPSLFPLLTSFPTHLFFFGNFHCCSLAYLLCRSNDLSLIGYLMNFQFRSLVCPFTSHFCKYVALSLPSPESQSWYISESVFSLTLRSLALLILATHTSLSPLPLSTFLISPARFPLFLPKR